MISFDSQNNTDLFISMQAVYIQCTNKFHFESYYLTQWIFVPITFVFLSICLYVCMSVVYLLLGAAGTQNLVKLPFSAVFHLFDHFKTFSVISCPKSTKNV